VERNMTVSRPRTESRDPGLPDAEFDDLLTEAIAQATGLDVEMPAESRDPDFPDWLPENIRETAGLFLWQAVESGSSALAMVERLIYDPRMEGVWAQLLQKSRTTGGFRLAANLVTTFGPDRADEIHHASTIVVFRDAVTFGVEYFQFAEQKRTHYLGQAEQLRSDARFLERALTERRLTSLSRREVHRMAKQFDDAANAYQVLGDLIGGGPRPTEPDPLSVVDYAILDEIALTGLGLFDKQMLAKRFAVNMAATMRGLFGAGVMYRTVATITRVALDDDEITDSAVREWCAQEANSPGPGDNAELTKQQIAWRHMLEIDRLMLAAQSAAVALRNTRTDINAQDSSLGSNLGKLAKMIKARTSEGT
jgi:hypothetical protein